MKKLILFLFFFFVISCTKDIEEPVMFTLTSTVNPAEGGSVSPANGQYESGDVATISAIPAAEYVFEKWTGGATGTSSSISLTMTGNKSVVANFIKKQYPLTIEIEGEGTVTETVIKQGLATDYNSGTIVELIAVPTGNWAQFESWTGDVNSNETKIQITIDKPISIKVTFKEKNLIINKTVTRVYVPGQSTGYLRASFYNVSGPFHYLSDDEHYFFYPGTVFWGQNKPN